MKTICKLKKDDLRNLLPTIAAAAAKSQFICKKCGRIAPDQKWLCKPLDLHKVAGLNEMSDVEL